MDKYIAAKEVAVKWGVSSTWVTILCSQGKLDGAVKEKNRWMLPEDIAKLSEKQSSIIPMQNLDS